MPQTLTDEEKKEIQELYQQVDDRGTRRMYQQWLRRGDDRAGRRLLKVLRHRTRRR